MLLLQRPLEEHRQIPRLGGGQIQRDQDVAGPGDEDVARGLLLAAAGRQGLTPGGVLVGQRRQRLGLAQPRRQPPQQGADAFVLLGSARPPG